MNGPRLTLWVRSDGSPVYIQCHEVDLAPEEVERIMDFWMPHRDERPIVLPAEWDIRVLEGAA